MGNEEADKAVKGASSQEGRPMALGLNRAREIACAIQLRHRDGSDNLTPLDTTRMSGQYT
jgi:hypothetical protein